MGSNGTGVTDRHLDLQQVERIADGIETATGLERGHLDLCAVCRAEIDRATRVRALVAELGEFCREEAPPAWPALSAIEAEARARAEEGMLAALARRIGTRGFRLAAAATLAVAVAVGAVVALRAGWWGEGSGPGSPEERRPVAAAGVERDVPVLPGGGSETGAGPLAPGAAGLPRPGVGVPPSPEIPAAARSASSSVVAVAAGRDVGFVVMNVPYEGGTAAVLWLSVPPSADGVVDVPM